MDQQHIRNFSIIAHIDHGKSTLADRILELTHTVDPREMRAQVLDSMDLERERGITIKAQAVRVFYESASGQTYQLHLIDTPGHVDFTYEVSRSLAACEGALLVVDASQGVEAQTVANTYLAVDAGLELIPCLNKLDLPGAEPERVAGEVAELIGEPPEAILRISGKTGAGVVEVLEQLVARVPPPAGDPEAPPRALIFDSEFDQYRGVIAYIRVVDGVFRKGAPIRAMASGLHADIDDIGCFSPQMMPTDQLAAGEVGYLITGVKDVTQLRVGDTLTTRGRAGGPSPRGGAGGTSSNAGGVRVPASAAAGEATEALPGYREVKPMVFCGLFPIDSDAYADLRDALEKLTLNDAALSWEPETSDALGFGFRCGFLGLLHMDIVKERLEREYDLELMATMPSVEFDLTLTGGEELEVHNPSDMPDPGTIAEIREPFIKAQIIAPREHVGAIMELCQERRGVHAGMHYLSPERVQLTYDLPLVEIVLDFFDQLKSRTRGYASLDYELDGMKPSNLVKLDVLLAGDPVDALSMVVHRDKAYEVGRALAERLRKRIPRQQYDVPIQAAVGSHIIARETVKAFRKDVIAKCYGGDITRKKKLLEKQKEGKKRMKQVGRVEVPQEAFLAVLELGEESK
ncbi:MAG TPA: translation elongation factor 4 [Solirubrobacteraceae bacterium]|jgi:GTP-binding protein LepA|nr:translation elongation factor 4 [Solirubrobacteraceae bacterium]